MPAVLECILSLYMYPTLTISSLPCLAMDRVANNRVHGRMVVMKQCDQVSVPDDMLLDGLPSVAADMKKGGE